MILSIVLFCSFALCLAAPEEDLITQLPGLEAQPSFKQYSGYLKASDTRFLHYWFTESTRDPKIDPLILWLNGGPGCSSLLGLLSELGPFRMSEDGESVVMNTFSWNKFANVIFLESPAGTGYSYAADNNTTTNDDDSAHQNLNALIDWFQKFPEYKNRDFYITGESYAGIYLPVLGVLLLKDKDNFPNFKGVAIGNGYVYRDINFQTLLPFMYYHGFVPDKFYSDLKTKCCNGSVESCNVTKLSETSEECYEIITVIRGIYHLHTDPYNLYNECNKADDPPKSLYHYTPENSLLESRVRRKRDTDNEPDNHMNNSKAPMKCQTTNTIEKYLRQEDVRSALNIKKDLPGFMACSGERVDYDKANPYHSNVASEVLNLLDSGIRVLLYNGDFDSVCNLAMNQQFVTSLNLTYIPTHSNNPFGHWIMTDESGHITTGGMLSSYEEGLDMLTIRGAGHMVPTDKPKEALQMIHNFINKLDYSTPFPGSEHCTN